MLAFAYFNSVARQPAGRDYLSLAGPGFRDFTRIAASDSTMWRDVLMSNREEVLKQSMRFRHTLEAMEHALKSGNIEAVIHVGLVAHHLIHFARDCQAGVGEYSFYAEKGSEPRREPARATG